MSAELNIPDAAIFAGWHEFRYPRPAVDEPSPAFVRGLNAAAPLLRAQWEAEQLGQLRAAVEEIRRLRSDYVWAVREEKRKEYRGIDVASQVEAWERAAALAWNEGHPALLALWRQYSALVEASKAKGKQS